jgi:hypothetical protein
MNTSSLSYSERTTNTLRHRVALVVAVGLFIVLTFTVSSAHAAECATGPQTFESVGAEQCYTVPSGVTAVTVTAVGAPGDAGSSAFPALGGFGAVASAQVPVTSGQTLYVEVGGSNGFNGGGGGEGGRGGGASDVRTCSAMAPSCPGGGGSLATRLVVAGGGGGGARNGSLPGISGIEMLTYNLKGGPGGSAGGFPEAGGSGASGTGADGGAGGGPGGTSAGGTPGVGGSGTTSSGTSGIAGAEGSGGRGAAGYEGREGGGGGGGGGYYGGGGGGGGGYEAAFTFGGGGGGGAGSSFIESAATDGSIATDTTGKPSVTITPVATPSGTTSSTSGTASSTSGTTSSPASEGTHTTGQSVPVESIATPPNVTDATESHHTWREGSALAAITRQRDQPPLGTTYSFTLSKQAQVEFAFTAQRTGRMSDDRCVAVTNKNRHEAICKRAVTAGTLTFNAQNGSHKIAFQGRVTSSTKLDPGTYTLAIVATNAAGHSRAQRLTFTIVT